MSGTTTCKEVCSTCKCTVIEKTKDDKCKKDKKKDCVATIVGVLSLPENFCCQENNNKDDDCCTTKNSCSSNDCTIKSNACKDDKKDDCTAVYRDLGECLQKCIVKTSKKGSDC